MLKRRRTSSFYSPAPKLGRRTLYRRPRARAAMLSRMPTMPLRANAQPAYAMRQFHSTATLTQSAASEIVQGLSMTLNGYPNQTAVSALFDKYRVDYMEYTFRPRINSWDVSVATSTAPRIFVAVDKDGSFPTTIAGIQQYQNCETHDGTETFTVRFKPGVVTGASTGGGIVAATNVVSPWVDMAVVTIQHYGAVAGCTQGAGTQLQTWDIDLYLGLSFKSVR